MHGVWAPPIAGVDIQRIAADMSGRGYGIIPDFISAAGLAPLRNLAQDAVQTSGGEYVHLRDFNALQGTVLRDLLRSASFKTFCQELYKIGTSDNIAPEADFYTVLRCLKGNTGQRHSYRFHYDSYVVTVLLPISIPDESQHGNLLIIPHCRPIRKSYFRNLLDKIIIDNPLSQYRLKVGALRKKFDYASIRLCPGDLYFFWGYQSIHTNEPCLPDQLRATALFHYGDPHQNSRVRALIRRVRKPL